MQLQALFPAWRPSSWLNTLRALWERPITVGHAIMSALGIYAIAFLLHDIYSYYIRVPLDIRGTLSRHPHFYIRAALIRLYRFLTGKDGTSSTGLRRWAARAKKKEEMYGRTFLKDEDVPVRRPPRPELINGGIPQRQVPQVLDPELEEKFESLFKQYATTHWLDCLPSRIEPNALALFLPPTSGPRSPHTHRPHPEYAIPRTNRFASVYELAHIHGGEGSVHLILAPLDAALVIDRGWGVRFPLAGAPGSWGYARGRVLVYAPRDWGEVECVMRCVEAGRRYLTAVPED